MDPVTAALITELVAYAVKYGIPAAKEIIILAHKPNPTLADYISAFEAGEVEAKKFLAEVPEIKA